MTVVDYKALESDSFGYSSVFVVELCTLSYIELETTDNIYLKSKSVL